jgi:hypothetical protein
MLFYPPPPREFVFNRLVRKKQSEILIQIFYIERKIELLDFNICRHGLHDVTCKNIVVFILTAVLDKRLLRRIFGPKRNEVTECWGKLRYEELHNLYSSSSIIRLIKSRRMRLAGHAARMEKMTAYRILVGRPKGKRPLGRPRRRWVGCY